MKRLKEQIEKDPKVKAEVKKGNIVTIIEDSMDY
jgi:transcription antitermination factor NusG